MYICISIGQVVNGFNYCGPSIHAVNMIIKLHTSALDYAESRLYFKNHRYIYIH